MWPPFLTLHVPLTPMRIGRYILEWSWGLLCLISYAEANCTLTHTHSFTKRHVSTHDISETKIRALNCRYNLPCKAMQVLPISYPQKDSSTHIP